jgi:spore maturation protein CgeB
MAKLGHCPSGRLFEVAGVGVPILSDAWEGLDRFFAPGEEILIAESTADALRALELPDAELARVAARARARALADHTAARSADELLALLAAPPAPARAMPGSDGAGAREED